MYQFHHDKNTVFILPNYHIDIHISELDKAVNMLCEATKTRREDAKFDTINGYTVAFVYRKDKTVKVPQNSVRKKPSVWDCLLTSYNA